MKSIPATWLSHKSAEIILLKRTDDYLVIWPSDFCIANDSHYNGRLLQKDTTQSTH